MSDLLLVSSQTIVAILLCGPSGLAENQRVIGLNRFRILLAYLKQGVFMAHSVLDHDGDASPSPSKAQRRLTSRRRLICWMSSGSPSMPPTNMRTYRRTAMISPGVAEAA